MNDENNNHNTSSISNQYENEFKSSSTQSLMNRSNKTKDFLQSAYSYSQQRSLPLVRKSKLTI